MSDSCNLSKDVAMSCPQEGQEMHNISHSYVVPGNKAAGISGHGKERKFPGLLQHALTTLSE